MESDRPLLTDLRQHVRGLGSDLKEMLALRWQLAHLEFESSVKSVRRLATVAAVAVVFGLTGVALLAACAAGLLDGRLGISREGWLATLGTGLLLSGGLLALAAWRRFRREFSGLRQTLEELREDALWLKEWIGEAEDA